MWETEVGTTVQNDRETVTKDYLTDYLSLANRDIMVYEQGSYTQRYVYDDTGRRISAEFTYAANTHPGEPGENFASEIAVNNVTKIRYRVSHLDSTLYAVDATGAVVSHAVYDPWGNPLAEQPTQNYAGIDNLNNFTGYTWDETLGLYFAQNRFYSAETHRFTQEDPVKDGGNWYVYCGNNPLSLTDSLGLYYIKYTYDANRAGTGWYYYPVKQGWVTTVAIAAANQLPFDLGNELIIKQQNKNGIYGGSSFIDEKSFIQKIKDIAISEGPELASQAVESVSKNLSNALGGVSKVIAIAGTAKDIAKYGNIAIMDNLAFKLMSLAGISIKEPTAELVVYRMDLAYSFITAYSDYFFGSPWPGSKSIFEMQSDVYTTSDAKNKQNKVDSYASQYYNILCCNKTVVIINGQIVSDPNLLEGIKNNFKRNYLDKTDEIIADLVKAFKRHIETPLGGYDAQWLPG